MPWLLQGAAGASPAVALVVLTTVVNFHHFMADRALWKLRDKRVRDILLA